MLEKQGLASLYISCRYIDSKSLSRNTPMWRRGSLREAFWRTLHFVENIRYLMYVATVNINLGRILSVSPCLYTELVPRFHIRTWLLSNSKSQNAFQHLNCCLSWLANKLRGSAPFADCDWVIVLYSPQAKRYTQQNSFNASCKHELSQQPAPSSMQACTERLAIYRATISSVVLWRQIFSEKRKETDISTRIPETKDRGQMPGKVEYKSLFCMTQPSQSRLTQCRLIGMVNLKRKLPHHLIGKYWNHESVDVGKQKEVPVVPMRAASSPVIGDRCLQVS